MRSLYTIPHRPPSPPTQVHPQLTLTLRPQVATQVAGSSDGLYKSTSPVIALTDVTLAKRLTSHTFMIVEFYSAWCGHCQYFAPKYEKIARNAAKDSANPEIVALDCANKEYSSKCSELKIRSYPTLIL